MSNQEFKPLAIWIVNPGKYDFWYGFVITPLVGNPVMIPWDYTQEEANEALKGLRNLLPTNATIDVRPYPGRVTMERNDVRSA